MGSLDPPYLAAHLRLKEEAAIAMPEAVAPSPK
jgi:hypothetical protein